MAGRSTRERARTGLRGARLAGGLRGPLDAGREATRRLPTISSDSVRRPGGARTPPRASRPSNTRTPPTRPPGTKRAAAVVALRLAMEHADRLETALWNAWVQRAIRADRRTRPTASSAAGSSSRSSERAWNMVTPRARDSTRSPCTRSASASGTRISRRSGSCSRARSWSCQAEVATGISMVDEGTLAAVGGELTPFAAGNIYCITIGVCRSLADYRRAGEWTEAANTMVRAPIDHWVPRHLLGAARRDPAHERCAPGSRDRGEQGPGVARTRSGGCPRREPAPSRSARRACAWATSTARRRHSSSRTGSDTSRNPGWRCCVWPRGRSSAARASIGAALADAEDPLERARLLPARVEIAIAAHDLGGGARGGGRAARRRTMFDAPMLHAAARQAIGAVLAAEDEARGCDRGTPRRRSGLDRCRDAVRDGTRPLCARRRRTVRRRRDRLRPSNFGPRRRRSNGSAPVETPNGARRSSAPVQEHGSGRRLERTFMFTDIVGSTSLVGVDGRRSMGERAPVA